MNEGDFNEHSPNAMFAKIIERLQKQDRDVERRHEENKNAWAEFRKEVAGHGKRIGALENWRWYIIGGGSVILLFLKFGAGH